MLLVLIFIEGYGEAVTVEIRGTNSKNKGAQLMLEAIVDRIGNRHEISVTPVTHDYEIRARLGIYQTLQVTHRPRLSSPLGRFVPREVRRRYGLISDAEVTAVLDASGFRYSDSFGADKSKWEAIQGRRWQRLGVPKVFMPQAFGPFHDTNVARWASRVLNQADMIFVRDSMSMQHLKQLRLTVPVDIAPDFTIGLKPIEITNPVGGEYFVVVPNSKIVTQGVMKQQDYVDYLVEFGRAAAAHGLLPIVLVHETSDRSLASLVATRLDSPTFEDSRPRALKGVIGGASILIGSRFHAIVGGLSQSVRCVTIGWSHKYAELLSDFDVPEWMVDADASPSQVVRDVLRDEAAVTRVGHAKSALVARADSMWEVTETIVNSSSRRKNICSADK